MAICRSDIELWLDLRVRGLLPSKPRLLELGEAQWYGDVVLEKVIGAELGHTRGTPYEDAKKFYGWLFPDGLGERVAVDGPGAPTAVKHDLNLPLDTEVFGTRPYDVVVNTGTFEHVFDQRQLFKTMHDWCAPGGLMFHSLPTAGWVDHGLYLYTPGLIRCLVASNDYQVLGWGPYQVSPGNHLLSVALRKPSESLTFESLPFRIPQQTRTYWGRDPADKDYPKGVRS